jgi:hypothetical protein
MRRIHGAGAPALARRRRDREGRAGLSRAEALVTTAGTTIFLWLAQRSFLFDANGLFNNMQFTGDDFFTDKDVCGIVLELPTRLSEAEVGLWARTVDKTGETGSGRPRWTTVTVGFLPGDSRRRTSASQRMMVALLRFFAIGTLRRLCAGRRNRDR